MIRNSIEYLIQLLNTIVEQLKKTIELCPWASRSYLQSQNESGFITVQKIDGRFFPTQLTSPASYHLALQGRGAWLVKRMRRILSCIVFLCLSCTYAKSFEEKAGKYNTAVLREAWAMLPESSSRPLLATLAQSRNLAHASLKTAVAERLRIGVLQKSI